MLKRKRGGEGWQLEILTESAMISFIFAGIDFLAGVCQGKGLLSSAQTFTQQQRETKADTSPQCTVKQQQKTIPYNKEVTCR